MKQIQVQLYPPKQPHWHGVIKKHWRSFGVFLVNFEKIPHLFLFGELLPPAFTSRNQSTDKWNYETCQHMHELCHINQTVQSTACMSVAISDSSYGLCFDLYLINILAKSRKTEMHRCLCSSGHFIVCLLLLRI